MTATMARQPYSVLSELLHDLKDSLCMQRVLKAMGQLHIWAVMALGGLGLLFPGGPAPSTGALMLRAGLEELVYRVLMQRELERSFPGRLRGTNLTCGALATSGIFAASHLFSHPPIMALLTFFPSLVLGMLWTRHRSFWLCAIVHLWYNLIYFRYIGPLP